MANFYDVNAAIQKPNVLGALQQGMQFGQQQRALREQRADQQQLRALAPQIQQGDPGAFRQAAAIDPQAASAQLSAGDMVTRRMEPLIKLLEEADARNPQEAQALWQSAGVPFVRQFSQGTEPVADWQQAKPMLAQLKTKIEMAKASQPANVQSTQILANGNIGLVTRTGQIVDTGQRASPTTQLINEPGQTPYLVTTGRGAVGQTTGIGPTGGEQQPIAGMVTPTGDRMDQQSIIDMANRMTQMGADPAQVDAWMESELSKPQYVSPVGGQALTTAPMPQRNPTQAEVEAAKTAAREQTELSFLPQRGQIEAQNAGATQAAKTAAELSFAGQQAAAAGATEEAKQNAQVRAELTQLLPKVQSESERTVALIDKALNHPGRATATGASSALDPRNFLPGTDATNFRTLLDQLRGGVFLQAFQSLKGGGAITQVEGQKAEQAIARLNQAQSDDEFLTALKELRDVAADLPGSIQRKLVAVSRAPASNTPPARPMTDADYNALPSGALFIDPDDGKTYKKP